LPAEAGIAVADADVPPWPMQLLPGAEVVDMATDVRRHRRSRRADVRRFASRLQQQEH
jgi:hypothetical protein